MPTGFVPGAGARAAHRALRDACRAEDEARKCAVLWFGDILRRRLYRDFGHSSMQKYARVELGFSENRIGDFMRLSRRLERLPVLREALPEIGYTKAREIVRVASPRSERQWVAAARTSTRRQLAAKVQRVKARSKPRPAAVPMFDEKSPAEERLAGEVPVRVSLELTAEQHARWEALWERLRKNGATGDRAEILLAALHDAAASPSRTNRNRETAPRGTPVSIHLRRCPDCERTTAAGRTLAHTEAERALCDATISAPGRRARATIPPRIRREVLARDGHRCRAPGCGRTGFLEIHHIVPRSRGGGHEPENLMTLCAGCHRLWHERGG